MLKYINENKQFALRLHGYKLTLKNFKKNVRHWTSCFLFSACLESYQTTSVPWNLSFIRSTSKLVTSALSRVSKENYWDWAPSFLESWWTFLDNAYLFSNKPPEKDQKKKEKIKQNRSQRLLLKKEILFYPLILHLTTELKQILWNSNIILQQALNFFCPA